MARPRSLVYGIGINNADYAVMSIVNGKQVICPFYRAWYNMLRRCYCEKFQAKNPTYIGCSVFKDWLFFLTFKTWMEKQDWEGKELDKDLLVKGNKVYSPQTCAFVDGATNSFTTDSGAARGDWPLGVYFEKANGKFRSRCSNPFTKKQENLGYFECQNQAHQAWRKRKQELALQLAGLQTDLRVASALMERYL